MFTEKQILDAQSKVKSGADFPELILTFKKLGIERYEHFVEDGSNVYHGKNNYSVRVEHNQNHILVSEFSSTEALKKALTIHQQGNSDYPTFCKDAGEAGVDKWVTDLISMTVTYIDKKGKILLVENIPVKK
ncbi:MAG: DUF1398 family protein [Leptospiraceae bacterium]|nr:DUF1398 family protein [Leptospiraceae bacterium]MCP5494485.1 DUF1398 family protein [Leptospiraceae bacterium]